MKQFLEKKEKKVEYIELIYDLIFVYIIGRNNALLHHVENGFVGLNLFFSYIFVTLAVIQIWNYTTYYINVFGKKSVREHIFLFINMFLLYFMAEGTNTDWIDYHTQYHIAWALILINIGVQYLCEYVTTGVTAQEKKRAGRMMAVLFSQAVLVICSIPLFRTTNLPILSPIAVVYGMVLVFFSSRNACKAVVDFNHLSERAMLFVVFTFGEMIIAMSAYFEGGFSFSNLYFSLFAFLIVVGLFLSYGLFYDHILDRERQTNGLGYMLLHIFIIFSLSSITVALEFMRREEVDNLPKILMIMVSFLMYFSFLFALGCYAKNRAKPSLRQILLFFAASALFAAVMIVLRENMYINIAASAGYVYAMFLLLYHHQKELDIVND